MSDDKEPYKPLAQRDDEECKRTTTLKLEPRVVDKIGVSLTVHDENPEKVVFALMDDWGQAFLLTDADQELLSTVTTSIFTKYEQATADNVNLIRLARGVHSDMEEHYPQRYNGQVRLRRAAKTDLEGYGGYKYRYIPV